MSTRAEDLHAQEQRRGPTPKARKRAVAKKPRAKKFTVGHATKHAGAKAAYALEKPSKTGKASRKSTRASANRAKADTNLNLREEMTKGSPTSRFRKARAKGARVRSSRG